MPRKGERKRARITPEIIEKMVELRKQGFTYKEISRELGIAFQTVAMHMQKEKMGGGRRKVTEEVLKEMRGLRKAGVPKKEIAEKLDLSYETVFKYLREEGLFKWVKRKMGLR